MAQKKCCCGAKTGNNPAYTVLEDGEMTLDQLPIGTRATIVKILPDLREKKKFADVGLIAGAELVMEAHAPFGGLLRVKILETSMALHRDDAAKIVLKKS
ncbi:MAG: ferrous iron transport protein A [Lentisphaeria bacterium]|nr:ferrous iron transport protein A [Lentisphaeria bacterium]